MKLFYVKDPWDGSVLMLVWAKDITELALSVEFYFGKCTVQGNNIVDEDEDIVSYQEATFSSIGVCYPM